MKKIYKILLISSLILFLLGTTVFLLVLTYQDELKEIAKKEINEQFTSRVEIEKIQISAFRRFPHISLILKDISIYEDSQFGDSILAHINRIYLYMNPFTFLKKDYVIDKIEINRAEAWPKQANNKSNYLVFAEQKKSTKNYSLDLKKIKLKEIDLHYLHLEEGIIIHSFVENIDLNGLFTFSTYTLEADATSLLNQLCIGGKNYLEQNQLDFHLTLQVNNETNKYELLTSSIFLDEIELQAQGSIQKNDSSGYALSIVTHANKIELDKLTLFIPDSLDFPIDNYQVKGRLQLDVEISGKLSKHEFPHIQSDFSIPEASIENKNSKTSIHSLQVEGRFSNGDSNNASTSYLHLKKCKAYLEDKALFANLKISNFTHAYIDGEIQANADLNTLLSFYPISLADDASGEVFIRVKMNSPLSSLITDLRGLEKLDSHVELKNVSIRADSNRFQIDNLSAELNQKKQLTEITDAKGRFKDIDFELSGQLQHLFSYLDDASLEVLKGKLKITCSAFKLDDLLSESEGENDSFHLPPNMNVKVDILCNGLIYESFITERIRGWFSIEDQAIMIDRLNFDLAEGLVSAKGMITENKDADFEVDASMRINKVDLNAAFILFDNFKQDYITNEHLEGIVSGHVQLSSVWNQHFETDLDRLFVLSEINVNKGHLNNFDPIINLMGFVKMKKMRNIEFDQIENSILIKDRVITIPYMDIRNSAFTMSLSGTHSFDEEIDYHMKINLSELFFKRQKQLKQDFDKAVDDEKGGLNMYVHMFGKSDEIHYRMDTKVVTKKAGTELKKEKEEFFDLFRKKKKTIKEEEFEFEWEEEK
jgi:hypothetical protein